MKRCVQRREEGAPTAYNSTTANHVYRPALKEGLKATEDSSQASRRGEEKAFTWLLLKRHISRSCFTGRGEVGGGGPGQPGLSLVTRRKYLQTEREAGILWPLF